MDLGELSVACLFGQRQPPEAYEIGLLWQGRELTVGGYKRISVPRGEWNRIGKTAVAAVHFDGFGAPASVDRIGVFLPDGTVLTQLPTDLRLGMPDTAIDLEVVVDMVEGQ